MMKNAAQFLGIIALTAIIGFSMTGCPTDDDGGGSGSSGSVYLGGGDGLPVTITDEQVYLVRRGWEDIFYEYTAYTGSDMKVMDTDCALDGEVKGGKLTFTLGIPTNLYSIEIEEEEYYYTGQKVSDPDVKVLPLEYFETINSSFLYNGLSKSNIKVSLDNTNTSATYTEELVEFIYVDRDVTLSGKGKTFVDEDRYSSVGPFTGIYEGPPTVTTKDYNIALKKGWNTIYCKREKVMTETSTKIIISQSLRNPSSVRWVMQGVYMYMYDDYDNSIKMNQRSRMIHLPFGLK